MSTLFKPPSVELLYNASCFPFTRLFPHSKVFCICFSFSRTEFGINASNVKYTILEIACNLKIVIFPYITNVSCAKVLPSHKSFCCFEAFDYMKYV